MNNSAHVLTNLEAITAEIERFDAASGGRFRQADDREAHDIVARIERKLCQCVKNADKQRLNRG